MTVLIYSNALVTSIFNSSRSIHLVKGEGWVGDLVRVRRTLPSSSYAKQHCFPSFFLRKTYSYKVNFIRRSI